jgi:small-conductance mechanosensitive channel
VIAIGARSTSVRTGTNVDIIVPNSSFLEQNVINWTLGDTRVRTQIDVGVAYGSDIEKFREVLMEAAMGIDSIVKEPDPFVLFTSFGDNALLFELHFWISIQTQMQRKLIESDVRFAIDALCRHHEIVIAFPQRDVHLDTLKPLEIRLLDKD